MKHEPSLRPTLVSDRGSEHPTLRVLSRALANNASMVATLDSVGHLASANRALLQAIGDAEGDVVGTPFSNLLAEPHALDPVREMTDRGLLDSGWKGECALAKGDGTTLPVSLTLDPVRDDTGRMVGAIGIAHHRTDHEQEGLRHSEEQFRQLAEHIRHVFFILSVRPYRTLYLSPAYEDVFGRPRPQTDGTTDPWSDAIHPDDRPAAGAGFARVAAGMATEGEFRIVRPDGDVRWLYTRIFPVRDADGHVYRSVGLCEDVTPWKQKEQELREARDQLHTALHTAEREAQDTRALTELVDLLQSCQSVDEAYRIAGKTLPKLLRGSAGALYITSPSRDLLEPVTSWGDDRSAATPFAPEACWALRRGKLQLVDNPASPVQCGHVEPAYPAAYLCLPLVAQGERLGVLHVRPPVPATPTDGALQALGHRAATIGERISLVFANLALRDVLRHQSIRDPLTRLFNRRYMEESLERECKRAIRRDQQLAVVMLDIDHFKHVNDRSGHQAGDLLLRAVSDLLGRQTRAENVACRYGGEEFAVILSSASVSDASTWANRFRADLKRTTVHYAGAVLGPVTVSLGIAGFPEHGTTAEELITAADAALYRAKSEGRDRILVAG